MPELYKQQLDCLLAGLQHISVDKRASITLLAFLQVLYNLNEQRIRVQHCAYCRCTQMERVASSQQRKQRPLIVCGSY